MSDYNHFKSLDADYQAGTLHPAFHKIYHDMAEKYRYANYNPPAHLQKVWHVWYDLRNVIKYDQSITYTELYNYLKLMNIDLAPFFVQLVMRFDSAFKVTIYKGQREMMARKENPVFVNH